MADGLTVELLSGTKFGLAGQIVTLSTSVGLAEIAAGRAVSALVQNLVTSSRVLGSVYHNTTGKPLYVCVMLSAALNGGAQLITDETSTPSLVLSTFNSQGFGDRGSLFAVVLPNNYYTVTVINGGAWGFRWVEQEYL